MGFPSICVKMSTQISWRFCFWSLVRSFGTTFVSCRLSCSICRTICLSMDILSAISRILSRRSSRKIFSISRILFVLFDVVGHPERSSSSTSVPPSGDLLCYLKTRLLTWILRRDSVGVSFNFTKNFKLILCWVSESAFFCGCSRTFCSDEQFALSASQLFSDAQDKVHLLWRASAKKKKKYRLVWFETCKIPSWMSYQQI